VFSCEEKFEHWNMKISEGKLRQAICVEDKEHVLQLNGRNIPFVDSVMYLGVILNRRMWRLRIKRTAAMAQVTIHKKLFPIQK
jgi:hypothetical protein